MKKCIPLFHSENGHKFSVDLISCFLFNIEKQFFTARPHVSQNNREEKKRPHEQLPSRSFTTYTDRISQKR